ncbi:MAG: radical SAM protein [Treponema sp.]|jgi:pyruvate formate lyase activating enzyme|nr:radical SAM protein [Treponema sp.]
MFPLVSLRKTSLVDYPGRISAAIFLPGCNLRCPWCQNRELVLPGADRTGNFIPLDEALALIRRRKKVLGGVVVSGGEPALYPALGDLAGEIHGIGLPVKLDTNGLFPQIIRELFKKTATRPDYIAMDLKLAPGRYGELLPGGIPGDPALDPAAALAESAALLRGSGLEYEFRSLALPGGRFGPGDVKALAPLAGGGPWRFRPFAPGNCLDPAWNSFPATGERETAPLEETAKLLAAKPGDGGAEPALNRAGAPMGIRPPFE